jgi:hypothetical protein
LRNSHSKRDPRDDLHKKDATIDRRADAERTKVPARAPTSNRLVFPGEHALGVTSTGVPLRKHRAPSRAHDGRRRASWKKTAT